MGATMGKSWKYTPEYKRRIAEESLADSTPGSVSRIAKREGISIPMLSNWRTETRGGKKPHTQARRDQLMRNSLLRIYGLTVEEYDVMLAAQGGGCAICGAPPDRDRSFGVDHCHFKIDRGAGKRSANRGLTCQPCNAGIAKFRDNPDLLEAAAAYLERHAAKAAR